MKSNIILAIESSCDDTAAAVSVNGKILANVVSTQDIHKKYGGVVPELASRSHQSNMVPVVTEALKQSNIDIKKVTAIAYTQGPGLLGSLLVGGSFAKGIALSLNIPMLGVNHLQAHIAAHYIQHPEIQFPFLCLLVSGGHTQIVKVTSHLNMEILGSTIDDAAGEAFDKGAKMLGLPYPGGPLIDKLAKNGNENAIKFPTAKSSGFNFSFSGIKTSLLYYIRDHKADSFSETELQDICASYQKTIVADLIHKLELAAKENNITHIALAGGVAANSKLRTEFENLGIKNHWKTYIPAFEYCTDNAAMIAMAGHYLLLDNKFTSIDAVPYARGG